MEQYCNKVSTEWNLLSGDAILVGNKTFESLAAAQMSRTMALLQHCNNGFVHRKVTQRHSAVA